MSVPLIDARILGAEFSVKVARYEALAVDRTKRLSSTLEVIKSLFIAQPKAHMHEQPT